MPDPLKPVEVAGAYDFVNDRYVPMPAIDGDYIPMIDEFHSWVHRQVGYVFTLFVASIPAQSQYYIVLQNPTGNICHFRSWHSHLSVGPATIGFYEDPTITSYGTPGTTHNTYRDSSNPSKLKIFYGATVSDKGELLEIETVQGDKSAGGSDEQETPEWVLKENEEYIIEIDNIPNAPQTNVSFHLFWVEPFTISAV